MTRYCVVYRTGGTERFEWRRSCTMSKEEAHRAAEETRRMGYRAQVEQYDRSVSIGLPETWDA